MKASQLVGKLAVRTAPVNLGTNPINLWVSASKDFSYITEPIRIVKVTDSHIVYKSGNSERLNLMDSRYIDDNWTDYEELVKPEEPKQEETEPDGRWLGVEMMLFANSKISK